MRIEKTALDAQNRCVYSLYKEKGCIGHAVTCADCFEALEIAPEWQSRGYGSYLLREVLRRTAALTGRPQRIHRATAGCRQYRCAGAGGKVRFCAARRAAGAPPRART